MSRNSRETRIYVGNLPPDTAERDLEDLFDKYGRVAAIDIKNRGRGPVFAFIDFEDQRDAKDAVYGRDGYNFDGYRLRVEFPRGAGPRGAGGRPLEDGYGGGGGGGRGYGGGGGYRGPGGGRGGPPRGGRGRHRIHISGLPPTGSWQDVKDHMREAGDVIYADVFKDGTGVVEFSNYDDFKYALKKLDDTKFKSHEGDTSYIRLKEDGGDERNGHGRSRSRSPVRRSRASPTYSPARGGRSRSRSRSHSRDRSYSRSRSRS